MAFKIYTKTGDKGETGLFGGSRISKAHIRIEAYGTIDELNAFIGSLDDLSSAHDCTIAHLELIQNELFNIGSVLASDPEKDLVVPNISEKHVTQLELLIDEMNTDLPALKNFILPSGHVLISTAHICRTVCRRAERAVVLLSESDKVDDQVLIYLNRLSDYLLTLARYFDFKIGKEEKAWNGLS